MYKIHQKVCSIDFSEALCRDRFIYLDAFWYKIEMSHNSCVIFLFSLMFSVLESRCHCYFVIVFVSNSSIYFFGKYIIYTYYQVYRTRTILQIYINFSQISIAKSLNMSFVNITFCCYFFQKWSY